jgi:hypothetical protein
MKIRKHCFFEQKEAKNFCSAPRGFATVRSQARPDDEAGLGQRRLNRAAPP